MTFDRFKIIIDKLIQKTNIRRLSLNMGEPFMNKYIFRMISYAKRKGFFVYISTNGQLMTEDYIINTIKTRVDALKFSIEGYTPEMYKNIRIGGDFEKVFHNVVLMKQLRDRVKSSLYIWISTILMKGNENLLEFIKFWGPYCDEIEYTNPGDHIGLVDNSGISLSDKWHLRRSCPQIKPFRELDVLSNGDVVICCVDFHAKCVLGNLLEQDFDDIWQSEKMTDIREKAYTNRTNEIDTCKNCHMTNYSRVYWEGMRFEVSMIHDAVKRNQTETLQGIEWIGGAGANCPECGKNIKMSYGGVCMECLQNRVKRGQDA